MGRALVTLPNNALRDNHYVLNPVTGLFERATLLELQRTNNLTWSEDLSNATWTKTRLSVALSPIVPAPDGTFTAFKLVEDTTVADSHFIQRASASFTAAQPQALSVFVRAAERYRGQFYLTGTDQFGVEFNLRTRTIVAMPPTGAGVLLRSRLSYVGGGWFRIEIVGTKGAGLTTGTLVLRPLDNAGNPVYTGDGASGMHAWGMQHEVDQSFATSYIPTTSATTTRSIDQFSLPLPAALQVPGALTLYVRFIERGSILLANFPRIAQIGLGGGAGTHFLNVRAQSTGFYSISHEVVSGAGVGAELTTAPVIGDLVELRGVMNADGSVLIGQSINGGAEEVSATSGPSALPGTWASNTVFLGGVNGSSAGATALLAVRIAAGVQSLATMRAV